MSSTLTERSRPRLIAWLLGLVLLPPAAPAAEPELPPLQDSQEAWLITVEPGEIYWQRFGHNAIWLREPARGLDHSFNFGYFDFEQEDFFLRFVTGRMLYQSLAFDAATEFLSYAREGRGIRAQRLNLDAKQFGILRDHLVWHVRPENRDYLYDYYLDNCSTRLRDAIDLALGGALSAATKPLPARLGLRDHTRRLTGMDYWYYLGLEGVLGRPVDRPVSQWDEMFIPGVLSSTTALQQTGGGPLVGEEVQIFRGEASQAPEWPPTLWPRYLALAAIVLALAWLAGWYRPAFGRQAARAWVTAAGCIGLVLLSLWLFTDHRVVAWNLNLALFNPLMLALFLPRVAKPAAMVVAAGLVVALVQAAWVQWQYAADVVALAFPLSLAAVVVMFRESRATTQNTWA